MGEFSLTTAIRQSSKLHRIADHNILRNVMAIKIYSNISKIIQSHKVLRLLSMMGIAVLYLGVGLGRSGLLSCEGMHFIALPHLLT